MADGTGGPDFQGEALALPAADTQLSLRIMTTTDLHAHLLPFDYFTDRPCPRLGLARTAGLIGSLRRTQPNNLLLDNGDMLQGSPLGDYVASVPPGYDDGPHPTIAAMNALHYDAAGLGNHDFNFGLRFLRQVMAGAQFPFVVSNAVPHTGSGFAPWLILTRRLRDAQGESHQLRIGLLGFIPPQTADWDQALHGKLDCQDIIEAAHRHLPALRAAGADLVIALAHSGIGPAKCAPRMEHAATALAGIDGIDVVIAGHTHQVFPGPDFQPGPGIDPERGSLQGKPAVMAGFGGAHLGVIDLQLQPPPAQPGPRQAGWRVAGFRSRCIAVDPAAEADGAITRPALKAHRETRRHFRRRIGRSETPLNSFFALIGHDRGLRLVAQAQRWHLRHALRGTDLEQMPLLSAVAPFRAGGRAGPHFYTDVPAGQLTLRSLADLYLFPNRMVAVQLDGRALRDWLERSAGIFNHIRPGLPDQVLLNPHMPPYCFDVIDGLTWQIDLTAAPLYTPDGSRLSAGGGAGRIRDLRHNGQPVTDKARFVMATNSYRLAACGLFAPVAAAGQVVVNQPRLTREIVHSYLRRRRSIDLSPETGWRFAPAGGAGLILETSPAAIPHLDDLNAHRPADAAVRCDGLTETGFARMRLTV